MTASTLCGLRGVTVCRYHSASASVFLLTMVTVLLALGCSSVGSSNPDVEDGDVDESATEPIIVEASGLGSTLGIGSYSLLVGSDAEAVWSRLCSPLGSNVLYPV